MATLRNLLGNEVEPMVGLTHLLRLCRDEHATLWEYHADPRIRERVAALLTPVRRALPEPGTASTVGPEARHALSATLAENPAAPPVVVAHALAELLDTHYGHIAADWFRYRSPYQPAVGDPIPLDTPDLRQVTELAPTAPPWRLANRLDETRHIRLAGAWTTQFRVVFDYSLFDVLSGVITADTVVATCHPNHNLAELGLLTDRPNLTFPVEPVDLTDQADRIDHLLHDATNAGASIVVLPELSVTESLARQLEAWVRRPGPLRLLVAGSFHRADPADRRRANRALAWVRGHPLPLTHDKYSPADRPVVEDITPIGWPEIRIYVTADGWRLFIAVCRDLLNPNAVHALSEAGANLVFAPSMSETILAFGGPVAQLVGSTQAIVAVANNPADWSQVGRPNGHNMPGRALFGHPGFPQQTRQVRAPDQRTGIAFLDVGSGRLRWHTSEPESASLPTPTEQLDSDPGWVRTLAQYITPARPQVDGLVTLRPAAVLVLLIDRLDGPYVLLAERASDLSHYSGQLVFPGGAADSADRDAIATALREAREEVGLDPTSVRVLGSLPVLGLPDSGFLITPVVCWSRQPRYLQPANRAEVTTIRTVPLASYRGGRPQRRDGRSDSGAPADDDGDGVGVLTSAILSQLYAYISLPLRPQTQTTPNNDQEGTAGPSNPV